MVVCNNCGYKGDSGKFCPKCGSPLSEETKEAVVNPVEAAQEAVVTDETSAAVPTEKKADEAKKAANPKKPLNTKLIATIAIAAVPVIALFTVIRVLFSGNSGFDTYGKDIIFIDNTDSGSIIYTADGKLLDGPECDDYSTKSSMDLTKHVMLTDEKDLYLVTKKDNVKVDDDVFSFAVSVTGDGIVYVKDYKDGVGDIYLYTKGKSTKVDSDASRYNMVVSPDGKSIAYMDNDGDCHLYINGKLKDDKLRNSTPVAISDGGKYFYYTKNDNLYVQVKDESNKLGADVSTITFNRDLTEAIYSYNGKTYFCKKGKEADETVTTKGACRILVPANATVSYSYADDIEVYTIGKDSLSNSACILDGGIYYINDDMVAEKIISSYNKCLLSDDGNTLVYYKGDDLYKVENLKKSLEAEEILGKVELRTSTLCGNDDLSVLYYYDTAEKELRCFKGKKPEMVYDDIIYDYSLKVVDNSLYFIGNYDEYNNSGTVCVSKKGDKAKEISSAETISYLLVVGESVYYYDREEDEIFIVSGSKEKSLKEDAYRD